MKILAFGDIYGRVWRAALAKELPSLQKQYNPDFIIANVDNVTSGRGAIEKHLIEVKKIGVDIMTWGDHVLDNMHKITDYISDPKSVLIRPANFQQTGDYAIPGKGYRIFEKAGKKLCVIHLIGQVYMPLFVNNPFSEIDRILTELESESFDEIVVDFHKEVTGEIYGMFHYLQSRVSVLFGTHTHVQTNDATILEGTGFLWDLWMCGPRDAVIGAEFSSVKKRLLTGISRGKIEQSLDENYQVCGAFFSMKKGECVGVEGIRILGKL